MATSNNCLKYDIFSMKEDKGAYLPNENDKNLIADDVLSLNDILNNALKLVSKLSITKIKRENVVFFNQSSDLDYREYCCFFHTPTTPTGKPAKYPLKLMFFTDFGMFGDIEYLQNTMIGKIHIVIWKSKKCYVINCLLKKDVLTITKIEGTNKTGEKEVLYKSA